MRRELREENVGPCHEIYHITSMHFLKHQTKPTWFHKPLFFGEKKRVFSYRSSAAKLNSVGQFVNTAEELLAMRRFSLKKSTQYIQFHKNQRQPSLEQTQDARFHQAQHMLQTDASRL